MFIGLYHMWFRIIDTAAVEYLELLARRARLFQTKAAFSTEGPRAGLDPSRPIAFPPLTWVVENFFQVCVRDPRIVKFSS